MYYIDIESIFKKLIEELKNIDNDAHLNERYLHHRFSFLLQQDEKYRITFSSKDLFHPEWATYIKDKRNGGRYYDEGNRKYLVKTDEFFEKDPKKDKRHDSGFIDFVIGFSNQPYCGIEFKMSKSIDKKGLIYDFMKLLDPKNKIDIGYSLAVYYGRKSKPCVFYSTIKQCLEEAKCRLEAREKPLNNYHFYAIEVFDRQIVNRVEFRTCSEYESATNGLSMICNDYRKCCL